MSDELNPIPKIEQVVMDIHRAHWDNERRRDEAKLTGWCGYEAWVRLMRSATMLTVDVMGARSISIWGCKFDKDPGQPVDDIVFQSNGAPVRRLNTRTMQIETITGPEGVLAREIKDLQAIFRGDYAITVERPYGLMVEGLPTGYEPEPAFAMTRSWNMQDFIDKGLVHKTDERTFGGVSP